MLWIYQTVLYMAILILAVYILPMLATLSMPLDAIVSCNTFTLMYFAVDPGDCTDGDVRLADGNIQLEGRPEVCINGVWGSICDSGWTLVDAHAFCTELGYPGTGDEYTLV